jgi:hypothetical protein
MLTESRDTRFQNHVGFDNLPIGEATKHNLPSLTLNIKHKGYKASKRSRSFMAGVDENAYSDYALEWLLDELVDDGDEVVCVRVLEKEVRASDQQYQEEAQALMQSIIAKNTSDKALSFVLEYAAGKLHGTFQKLVSQEPLLNKSMPPFAASEHEHHLNIRCRFICTSQQCLLWALGVDHLEAFMDW